MYKRQRFYCPTFAHEAQQDRLCLGGHRGRAHSAVSYTHLAGHDIVVFDKLTDENGNVIADHRDIEDAAQTVKTVKLTSNATDKADGDKVFDANARGVTIVDTVSYANLVPGEQYVLKGALMDRETCLLYTSVIPERIMPPS